MRKFIAAWSDRLLLVFGSFCFVRHFLILIFPSVVTVASKSFIVIADVVTAIAAMVTAAYGPISRLEQYISYIYDTSCIYIYR